MATLHSDAFGARTDASYRPSANEEFMSPEQVAYFRQKLLGWKDAIVRESRETMTALASGPIQEADLTDRASSETDWGIHLRTRDRQRKLIAKIDSAERRVDLGDQLALPVPGTKMDSPIRLARRAVGEVRFLKRAAGQRRHRLPRFLEDLVLPLEQLAPEISELLRVHELFVGAWTIAAAEMRI